LKFYLFALWVFCNFNLPLHAENFRVEIGDDGSQFIVNVKNVMIMHPLSSKELDVKLEGLTASPISSSKTCEINYNGQSDWRFPSMAELVALANLGIYNESEWWPKWENIRSSLVYNYVEDLLPYELSFYKSLTHCKTKNCRILAANNWDLGLRRFPSYNLKRGYMEWFSGHPLLVCVRNRKIELGQMTWEMHGKRCNNSGINSRYNYPNKTVCSLLAN